MTGRNDSAQSRYYYQNRARIAERNRQLRDQRRAQGLCTMCGASETDPEHLTCAMCRKMQAFRYKESPDRQRQNMDYKRARYQQRAAEGLCVACGKEPAREGRRMCEKCAAVYNAKARARSHREGAPE